MEVHFKDKMTSVFSHLAVPGQQVCDDDIRSLMFGDYMSTSKGDERFYDEIKDLDLLKEVDHTACCVVLIESCIMKHLRSCR